jgi:peptidyl-prolyl cis-trans isomerase C
LAAATLAVTLAPAAWAQNLAVVNGKAIPKARLDALAQQAARAGRQIPPEQLREIVITREIFAQAAAAQGLDATEEYKNQLELTRQQILIQELISDYQAKNPVSDAEAKAEYDKFAAENAGKEYRARHILVEKEELAKSLIAQIKKGAKFEDLAKKNSKDPGSGANGGDLDWASPGNYVKEFADALLTLTKGKTTETPVKTQFGYHIIRLEDVRDPQLPKLEDVKPQIAQQLTQQKLGKFQEDLRSKAKVE